MKKSKQMLAVLLSVAMLIGATAGCGSKEEEPTSPAQTTQEGENTEGTGGEAPATAGEEVSHDELVELAKQEGSLVIYSNSSRHAAAGEAFEAKYGIKVESTQLKDSEMIERVSKESASNLKGADVVFAQDGGRVYGELIAPGFVSNYVPPALVDVIAPENQNPLVFNFLNKVIVYNNENDAPSPITNLWQLAEPEFAGRFQMKDPFQEGVNMNFLTMLTKPEYAEQLANAYKDLYGEEIELTTENAGYEWIKRVFENKILLSTSDTIVSEAVGFKGQDTQLVGLFTFNKARMAESKDLALDIDMEIAPFTGFYYPMYAMIPNNSQNINAAKLFIEFTLSEEGYGPWMESPGDYSANPEIPVSEGDFPLSTWEPVLVREEPEWCFAHRAEVEDFLNDIIA